MNGSSTRFRRAAGVPTRSVGGDVLVAPRGRDDFDILSGTATAVWTLLASPQTVPDLVDTLAEVYRVSPESIAGDVRRLIAELASRGMLEEVAESDA